MDINIDEDIEKQINKEFKEQIEDLPEEYQKPVENTLNYIKKRARCNDYEAGQIQALMSVHSGQKKGFDYYTRYISGQSTPEEDKADYYISIRKSWDKFLAKYANMTEEERVNALITSSSFDKVVEVLSNASPKQLEYILEKTEEEKNKLEKLSNELSSRKKSYLITHPNYTMNKIEEFNNTMKNYNKKVITSAKTYELKQTPPIEEVDKYNAYSNGIEARNSIRTNGKDVTIEGREFSSEIHDKKELKNEIWNKVTAEKVWGKNEKGEGVFVDTATGGSIIQIQLKSKRANMPMYLYAHVYEKIGEFEIDKGGNVIKDTGTFKCRVITLQPIDKNGKTLNIDAECKKTNIEADKEDSDLPTEIDFLSLVGYDIKNEKQKETRIITLNELVTDIDGNDSKNNLSNVKFRSYIRPRKVEQEETVEEEIVDKKNKISFADLYTIYQRDPTYLKHRIASLGPTPDEAAKHLAKTAKIIGNILTTVGGILLTIVIITIIIKICGWGKPSENPNKDKKTDFIKIDGDGGKKDEVLNDENFQEDIKPDLNETNVLIDKNVKVLGGENPKEDNIIIKIGKYILKNMHETAWSSLLSVLASGVTLTGSGITSEGEGEKSINEFNDRKVNRKKELLDIYQDMKKHNEFPEIFYDDSINK